MGNEGISEIGEGEQDYEMYCIGNIVHNIMITLVTDDNYTYRGEYFIVYINVESLCFIYLKLILNVKYTSTKNTRVTCFEEYTLKRKKL